MLLLWVTVPMCSTQCCTLQTCYALFLWLTVPMCSVQYCTLHMLCLVAMGDCTHVLYAVLYSMHLLCLVALVDCTHVQPSSRIWLLWYRRTLPTTQLQSPLDLVTVSKEWQVHKLNSRSDFASPNFRITNK